MTAQYAENSTSSTKITIINDSRNRGRYKINIQNSTVFPYTSNTQFQMKLKQKGIQKISLTKMYKFITLQNATVRNFKRPTKMAR